MLSKLSWLITRAITLLRTHAQIDRRLDEIQYIQGSILALLSLQRQGRILADFEFKVFSQWGEDGIIQKLTQHLDIQNKTFIEFGVQDFRESNCRFLLMHNNWKGLVIDGSAENIASINKSSMAWRHHLNAVCAFIDRDNINELLDAAGFGEDVGILSIDIDGVDYWIYDAIAHCKPRILIVEYNSVFGPNRAITVPYDPLFTRNDKHFSNLYFGASLAAYHHLATQRGYSLIGTNSAGSNAFFVRDDLMKSCLFPALSTLDAFTDSHVRESKDQSGRLTFLSGEDRLSAIIGLPVVNVLTGNIEPL